MKPDIIVYDINLSRVGVLDDYAELTTQRSWRETGIATVTINRNIPNATLLTEGAILIIGDDPKDSFKVVSLQDSIDSDGKVSQMLVATCEDLRCLLKQRLIMDLGEDGFYSDSNPAETVIKNLVASQCVSSSDSARNFSTLTVAADQARGVDAVINTKYTSVYDACVSVSKQSNIGWYIYPDIAAGEYILDCAEGVDRTASVFFDYNFESLQSADYTEDIRSYRNLAYVGGAGSGIDREIYTGFTETTEPAGFDRFETFVDAGSLNTEAELQARAEGALEELQVSSSVSMDGLQKSPFIYKENYNCGDVVTVRFNDHTIQVRLYVISESWMPGEYDIGFEVGKPRPDIRDQIGQIVSTVNNNSTMSEDGTNNTGMRQGILSVDISSGFTMTASQCIYNILEFTGTLTSDRDVVLYLDTTSFLGRKAYHIIFTATVDTSEKVVTIKTAETGKSTVQVTIPVSNEGFYIDVVVDGAGNVIKQVAVYSAESGNSATATKLATARKINNVPFDGTADITTQESPPTPWAQYSGKDIPQLPDNVAGTTYKRDNDWVDTDGWIATRGTVSVGENKLICSSSDIDFYITKTGFSFSGASNRFIYLYLSECPAGNNQGEVYYSTSGHGISASYYKSFTITEKGFYRLNMGVLRAGDNDWITSTITGLRFDFGNQTGQTFIIQSIYIGTGAYDRLVFDNSYHYRHMINNAVIPTPQGLYFNGATSYLRSKEKIMLPDVFTFSATVNCAKTATYQRIFEVYNSPTSRFYIYISQNTNNLAMNYYNPATSSSEVVGINNFFVDNTDIDTKIEIDFINKTIKFYKNNILFYNATVTGIQKPTEEYLYIGSDNVLGNVLLGYMRNICIYDTALTDTQRNWLAQGNTPPILYDVTNWLALETLRYNASFLLQPYSDGKKLRIANTSAGSITATASTGQTIAGGATLAISAGALIDLELVGTDWKRPT